MFLIREFFVRCTLHNARLIKFKENFLTDLPHRLSEKFRDVWENVSLLYFVRVYS